MPCGPWSCLGGGKAAVTEQNAGRDSSPRSPPQPLNGADQPKTRAQAQSVYHETVQSAEDQDWEKEGDEWEEKATLDEKASLAQSLYFDSLEDLTASILVDMPDDGEAQKEGLERVKAYPTVVTTSVQTGRHNMSMLDPKTLLRTYGGRRSKRSVRSSILRGTVVLRKQLTQPEVKVGAPGYPGELTEDELEACQTLRRELEKRDEAYKGIVYGWNSIEEEPYALCRFLRARKFEVEECFKMMEPGLDKWREAKKNDFYRDTEKALGAPMSVILTQYPYVYIGHAKNGCPVSYFNAGHIKAEGLQCITTFDEFPKLFWNQFMFKFTEKFREAHAENPDVVRCESVNIIDLKGLSTSQLNGQTVELVKKMSEIGVCFPEMLHCLIILNAPGFFSFAWRIIKRFLDARTVSKIKIYSDETKGRNRLMELIDKEQLPSDYGGNGPSTASQIQMVGRQHGEDDADAPCRQLVHLLHAHKKGLVKYEFELVDGESVMIRVYTQSSCGATFSLSKGGGDAIAKVDVQNPDHTGSSDQCPPFCKELVSAATGPGKFKVEGQSLGNHPGHFLIVCNVSEVCSA